MYSARANRGLEGCSWLWHCLPGPPPAPLDGRLLRVPVFASSRVPPTGTRHGSAARALGRSSPRCTARRKTGSWSSRVATPGLTTKAVG
ncbi:unnamed protein product [Effrenium voratum]|nr:unnamed protein product [Effrenium voratum]